MPRTKQIHPRNLRDKIEEAQKELNGAEVSKKEILEAGAKGASESLKGVKRKKIVAENHLKKIPKSPLRNPLQAKHKQNTEASAFAVPQSAPEPHRKAGFVPMKNGKSFTQQNGETPTVAPEASKPEASASPKRPPLPQHPAEPRRWRSQGADPARLGGPSDRQASRASSSRSRSDDSERLPAPAGPAAPLYPSTAFDVLLKAMEPELSTLSQRGSSCAVKTDKPRPSRTVRSPPRLKSSCSDAPGPSQDLDAQPQCSPPTSYPAPAAVPHNSEPAAAQPLPRPPHPQEPFAPRPAQHTQLLPGRPGFPGSPMSLQTPENTRPSQLHPAAGPADPGLPSPSSRTQVTPANQHVDTAAPSISPASATLSPLPPAYSSAHVTSVVTQSVEQMCSLLLRDQKPKKQGKYICEYCSRACAKPSVLLKHVRSHTGERPYPCVTCGFSFKTKSNLYKHKKSHAHTIKLGLVLQPEAGGLFLSQESPKALSVHSDAEDTGDSEEEGAEVRQTDPGAVDPQPLQIMRKVSHAEALPKVGSVPSNPDHALGDFPLQERPSESQAATELLKVVVHPVTASPLRADSPKVVSPKPDLAGAQRQKAPQVAGALSHPAGMSPTGADEKFHPKVDTRQPEGKQDSHAGPAHAQLQRQQATDDPQEQQGKLLSPRSLGSTDSGYFSRSESADQTASPPTPFARAFPTTDSDPAKNSGPPAPRITTPATSALPAGEKPSPLPGQMRPPLATKTLEERISKLISDNEALVDDKQLDSVKPRRTSLSRRGSIDSPKSYIFKDSFQFDLKPMGRRTSSSSDIPKSPFTPTEKSKQVFLLSVPSLDCLPITRSNSMPTTGYSAVPTSIIPPPHPLRGSQSFDDKIGAFYDDVFLSGPNSAVPPSGHPRPLVRQAAVEDSSAGENHALGTGPSLEDSCQGCPAPAGESGPARSKATNQGAHLEKRKSHQGRGTMFECETCRNRYRKLENFENHKKFYCSELHGPKTKAAMRDPEHSPVPGTPQPQVLHYRVAGSAGVWEQTSQIRKRRKMKSIGDDEELQPQESGTSPKGSEAPQPPSALGSAPSLSRHPAARPGEQLHPSGHPPSASAPQLAAIVEQQMSAGGLEKADVQRQGAGISVIQHTNSLSRPGSLDTLEPSEGGTSVPFQELSRSGKPGALKITAASPEKGLPWDAAHAQQPGLSEAEGPRRISSERQVLGQPSRLVRQHNIQVPEILVTEEPDRDPEGQAHDEEKSEKFSWPQRSETLAKLPTEKLPPKKKRLRLAEMERSSTESSFESTLSRSLSRESSLSHASSFSASLDVEDIAKAEASPKIDFPNKAEFLLTPPGSDTLSVPGGHREMRRAASEQSGCVPTLMEVSDFRSKSFDCGSVAPPQVAPLESLPSTVPSVGAVSGHVPLLERRRGPLIRQISLNIAPESRLSPVKPSSFHSVALASVNAVPFWGPLLASSSLAEFPTNTSHSQARAKDLQAEVAKPSSTDVFPVQQLFGINLVNQTCTPLSLPNTQLPLQVYAQGSKLDTHSAIGASSTSSDCFAPKYQLQRPVFPSGQACSSNSLNPLPNQALPDAAGADLGKASVALPTKLIDPLCKSHPLPPLELRPPGSQGQQLPPPFPLPTHLQASVPAYCFATSTSLPQILVTQDLSSSPLCHSNPSTVPISKEQNSMPKVQKEHQNVSPNPEQELACKGAFSEMGPNSSPSESSPMTEKVSVGRLSLQPESSASSKRMLSPANSLDIAMEKHQKRAKDENGAACAADGRPSDPLRSRAPEGSKQKKPVLVRQLCTTEPLEGASLEQNAFSQPEASGEAGHLAEVLPADGLFSGQSKLVGTEPSNELQELEAVESSASSSLTVQNSPIPSENAPVSPLKSIDGNQEREPARAKSPSDKGKVQGQGAPATSAALLSAADPQQLPFPSLKTATSFTWCYLARRKSLPLPQKDQKTSAYTDWAVGPGDPDPLGLPTKVALSLLNSKQKTGKALYCHAITTQSKSDLLVYSSKWQSNLSKRALGNQKSTVVEFSNKDASEINSEQDKENSLIKSEPRRIKIFDGGYKSNEEYVYVRGRGRGKYICEECGIRCKKPSMLKKHIRTHTDVRPYHCTYCNFSFKTKGNLTKHMKSKAHSKKCVDLGVSVGLIDEPDAEEPDEKQRFSCERPGYDLEESDGPDEDENENEDDDEDSQAESGLSAAPSVTASPQHLPSRGGLQDAASAEDELRVANGCAGAHLDPMDVLPRALLTKMTVLSAAQASPGGMTGSPATAGQRAERDEEGTAPVDAARSPETAPRSPCRQMSVDCPELDGPGGSVAGKPVASTQDPSSGRHPPAAVELSLPGAPSTAPPPRDAPLQQPQAPVPAPTHLFSHLPLHSQQQPRAPYGVVPVGGIHVVPAGLAYSALVPVQGPLQLTIPALGVIHGPPSSPGRPGTDTPLPCVPLGPIRVPGLDAVGLVGLAGAGGVRGPAPHLALGLQVVNLALPALLPAEPMASRTEAPPRPPQPPQGQAQVAPTRDTEEGAAAPRGEPELSSTQGRLDGAPGALGQAQGDTQVQLQPSGRRTLPAEGQGPRAPTPRRPPVRFSDVSSDEDEDRLVIAT